MLTSKQQRFVDALLRGESRTAAAIAAGYSAATARTAGSRLAQSKIIRMALEGKAPESKKKTKRTPPAAQPSTAAGKKLTPLDYMLGVINDPETNADRRDRMAIAAAPFVHGKVADQGKKEGKQDAAKAAAGGKFAAASAPRLVRDNTK